jgi:hypothetical protein
LGNAISRAILLGFACPEGIWVGSRVSEVQEAFVTTVMTLFYAPTVRLMHPLPVSVPVATQSNLSLSLRWSPISRY